MKIGTALIVIAGLAYLVYCQERERRDLERFKRECKI
jgi:hypothetical protein